MSAVFKLVDNTSGQTSVRSAAATALLPRFVSRRASDVATLRSAVQCGDLATIFRIGHNLRGSSQSYGFPELALLGEALEAAASAQDWGRVPELIARLETWRARLGGPAAGPVRTASGVHLRAMSGELESRKL